MKADVTSLVSTLSNGDADAISVGHYYDHAIDDLARYPWFVQASLVTLAAGTAEYTLNDDYVKLVAVFYNDRLLDRVDDRALESINPYWRDEVGTPRAYTTTDEDSKTYRLYPAPDKPSGNFIFVYGSPMGLDYPPYAALLFHTELRSDLPVWMDLPMTFTVLAREYGHESNHRDDAFAAFCQGLADTLWIMVS
jgi:hypothetical protein